MEHTQYAECNVGGVIAGWDARAGGWTPGAARRQGGVQNRALCPENWHPPGGGQKKRNLALYILVGSTLMYLADQTCIFAHTLVWTPLSPPI